MADTPHPTRLTELKDAVFALKELSAAHSDQISAINDALSSIASSMSMLDGKVDQLRLSSPSSRDHPRPSSDFLTPRSLKLDFPRFDGSDASGWLFKADQFFLYYSTPDEQRLSITSFHVDGPALAWFQWMHNNQQLSSWSAFRAALLSRFGPTAFDDPQGALAELTQPSTIEAYQEQFEALANRTSGLSPSFMLSCFVAGLKPELRRDVLSFRPQSLLDAIGLARLQQDKHSFRRSSTAPFLHRPPLPPLLPAPPSKPPPVPPLKTLSLAEQQERRAKGLCFNCDEKYHRGHRCKSPQVLLLLSDEASDPIDTIPPADDAAVAPPLLASPIPLGPEISFQALAGHHSPQTLSIMGRLNSHPVHVLVDCGSTHNFIQQRVAEHLRLPITPADSFSVTVGNGDKLPCCRVCPHSMLFLSDEPFAVDLYVLPLHGADVVLGVQWLQQLGPVTFDYSQLTLQFTYNSKPFTLSGTTGPQLQLMSSAQMLKAHNSSIACFLRLEPIFNTISDPATSPSSSPIPPEILKLLNAYPALTTAPSGLPPLREHDHHIHLLPGASPTNVRPYRYPHYQKKEIESIIPTCCRMASSAQALAPSPPLSSSLKRMMARGASVSTIAL